MKKLRPIKTHCNSCSGEKNHQALFTKSVKDPVDDSKEEYCMVQCMGCDTISFLRIMYVGDAADDTIHFNYPESADYISTDELLDDYMHKLPRSIYNLYEEVVTAYDCDSVILTGIGLRTLVEAVCVDQKIPGQNLKDKIEGLSKKGLISSSELPILHKLRLIGNDSAHEIKSLSLDKLEIAIGIIDHVLKAIYVLPHLNRRLKLKS